MVSSCTWSLLRGSLDCLGSSGVYWCLTSSFVHLPPCTGCLAVLIRRWYTVWAFGQTLPVIHFTYVDSWGPLERRGHRSCWPPSLVVGLRSCRPPSRLRPLLLGVCRRPAEHHALGALHHRRLTELLHHAPHPGRRHCHLASPPGGGSPALGRGACYQVQLPATPSELSTPVAGRAAPITARGHKKACMSIRGLR